MNHQMLIPKVNVRFKLISLILLVLMLGSSDSFGQKEFGLFDHAVDVGPVLHTGSTSFDPQSGTYELAGAGANIWFTKDELHYAYKKLTGDFKLEADGYLVGEGVDAHRKFGWMIRAGLDTTSVMIAATVHGDGMTAIQFRKHAGDNIEEVKSTILMPSKIQLERRGRSYFMSIARDGEPFWTVEIPDLEFPEEVYAGLFICSHNEDVVERVKFKNVKIEVPVKKK